MSDNFFTNQGMTNQILANRGFSDNRRQMNWGGAGHPGLFGFIPNQGLNPSDSAVLHMGDSITQPGFAGLPVDSNYTFLADHMFTPVIPNDNQAFGGAALWNFIAQGSNFDETKFDPSKRKHILTLLHGANNLKDDELTGPANEIPDSQEDYFANLKQWGLDRLAAGWSVVMGTILPQAHALSPTQFDTKRLQINTWIREDPSFYNALADVGGDPVFGIHSAALDTTYYIDTLHPSVLTHSLMAPYFFNAMVEILD